MGDQRARAALGVYATLLGGSMGSRLFDEIREQRGLAYQVYAFDHAFADVPVLQLSAGLESGKCVEAFERMTEIVDELRSDGPTEAEVERARAYAAGRLVLAFENTNAVARYAAGQAIVRDEAIDPDAAIAAIDAVTFDEVADAARRISTERAVACVGPHTADEFRRLRASTARRCAATPGAWGIAGRSSKATSAAPGSRGRRTDRRSWSSSSPAASTASPGWSAFIRRSRCGTPTRWATGPRFTATRRSSSSASSINCPLCARRPNEASS